MEPRLLVCSLVLLASVFSGCHQTEDEDGTDAGSDGLPGAYVLQYRIVDDTSDQDPRSAEPGHHCGDASKSNGTLTIGLWPDEQIPDEPWLAVFPELPVHWHPSIAAEPFKTTFTATVDPNVQDDDTTLGGLDHREENGETTILLDGHPISLPHEWTVEAQDGSWHADVSMERWDGDLETERYSGLCD